MSTPGPDPELASALDAAWAEVESHWEDDEAHRRFIALCAMQGALPTAGQRYRAVRDADPTRSERARRQIEAIMAAALANLDLTRTPRAQGRRRVVWMGYGLTLFFLLYSLLAILRSRRP